MKYKHLANEIDNSNYRIARETNASKLQLLMQQ